MFFSELGPWLSSLWPEYRKNQDHWDTREPRDNSVTKSRFSPQMRQGSWLHYMLFLKTPFNELLMGFQRWFQDLHDSSYGAVTLYADWECTDIKPGKVAHSCNSMGKLRQEDCNEFETSLGCNTSARSANFPSQKINNTWYSLWEKAFFHNG